MRTSQAINTLGRNDTRLVTRDSFLIMISGYAVLMALVFRYFVPWLTDTLLESAGFDLTPYYAVITGWLMVTIGPQLAGTVFGYLLLDEKDGDTLKALMVTPLSLETFLSYRVVITGIFGFIIALMTILVVNLVDIPFYQAVLISVVAGLYAPISALFLGTAADNKVEAFALVKIMGVLAFVPVIAWFVAEPWQYLFGIFPPFWATKAVWVAAEGGSNWWLFLLIGLVEAVAVIWWLVRRFERTAHK